VILILIAVSHYRVIQLFGDVDRLTLPSSRYSSHQIKSNHHTTIKQEEEQKE
jgi:hypothetical protein